MPVLVCVDAGFCKQTLILPRLLRPTVAIRGKRSKHCSSPIARRFWRKSEMPGCAKFRECWLLSERMDNFLPDRRTKSIPKKVSTIRASLFSATNSRTQSQMSSNVFAFFRGDGSINENENTIYNNKPICKREEWHILFTKSNTKEQN